MKKSSLFRIFLLALSCALPAQAVPVEPVLKAAQTSFWSSWTKPIGYAALSLCGITTAYLGYKWLTNYLKQKKMLTLRHEMEAALKSSCPTMTCLPSAPTMLREVSYESLAQYANYCKHIQTKIYQDLNKICSTKLDALSIHPVTLSEQLRYKKHLNEILNIVDLLILPYKPQRSTAQYSIEIHSSDSELNSMRDSCTNNISNSSPSEMPCICINSWQYEILCNTVIASHNIIKSSSICTDRGTFALPIVTAPTILPSELQTIFSELSLPERQNLLNQYIFVLTRELIRARRTLVHPLTQQEQELELDLISCLAFNNEHMIRDILHYLSDLVILEHTWPLKKQRARVPAMYRLQNILQMWTAYKFESLPAATKYNNNKTRQTLLEETAQKVRNEYNDLLTDWYYDEEEEYAENFELLQELLGPAKEIRGTQLHKTPAQFIELPPRATL